MTKDQLLDQLQTLLSRYSPVVERNCPLQVQPVQSSTKDFQPQQFELPTIRKIHQTPSKGVRLWSPRDHRLTIDKGVANKTLTHPDVSKSNNRPAGMQMGIRARCEQWLAGRISKGLVPLPLIMQEASELGYSAKALRVARKQLGVQSGVCLSLPANKLRDH